jgi:predicted Zn-dependent protease
MNLLNLVSMVSLAFFLTSCASSPTGRRQLLLFPESKMSELGVASFSQMVSKKPTSKDPSQNKYIRCITDDLLKAMGETPSSWKIEVFNDKTPNAFALPGKRMGIHTGMIDLANNTDQLAAVIGHEIGHVLAKHSNERMSQQTLTSTGLQVGTAFLGAEKGKNDMLIMGAMGLVQYGVLLPYSRKHETEADELGQKFMAKAGYDPRQAAELWKLMSKGGSAGPEFLSTHPSPSSRIANLSSQAGQHMQAYNTNVSKARCKK